MNLRTADFVDRIPAGIIDELIPGLAALFVGVLGLIVLLAGDSGALVAVGLVLLGLALLVDIALIVWNRVVLVVRTGQSIGKRVCGLQVVDATSGLPPAVGPALLRELVGRVAGVFSWLWVLIDDQDRSLADLAAGTIVVHHGG
ncbi:RDD family protein [Janibacter corallicola]|uniref:RDD family protein n=1 Tax=Janibacter corallicola TaxID=415212 RepID=UPI000832A300|nr:RDD family protein [Janibacter corallicola]